MNLRAEDWMQRRAFIGLLGGISSTLAVKAQPRRALPVIGVLSVEAPGVYAPPEFLRGLSEGGFAEGHNVDIEYHWADGRYDRLPALAAELVRRQVSVIAVIGNTRAALAAKGATDRI